VAITHGDRREVLHRVERQRPIERAGARHGAGVQQHGVAVRRRLCHRVGTDVAAGARPVVDHHRLLGQLLELQRDDLGQHADPAARRVGHDDMNGAIRIALRLRARADRQRHGERQQ